MEIDHDMLSQDYEPETRQLMAKILREGDSFLIAGAHQGGLSSYAAALVGPTGQIYCFEPHEGNRLVLEQTMEPFKNAFIYPYALGDREREAILFENLDNSGGHSLYNVGLHPANVKTRENPTVQNVEVKTLDSLFENDELSRLRLILFDVEGAELSALKGGINTIVDNEVPFVITEINSFALQHCGTDQMTLRAYMTIYGYECFVITSDGLMDTNPRKPITCATEEGQAVVFNVLFSRKGKV